MIITWTVRDWDLRLHLTLRAFQLSAYCTLFVGWCHNPVRLLASQYPCEPSCNHVYCEQARPKGWCYTHLNSRLHGHTLLPCRSGL